MITAHGELDAANALDSSTTHCATRPASRTWCWTSLVVEFFGTAGFSALHTLNVRCAGDNVDGCWCPAAAVNRLLHICDPESALPVQPTTSRPRSGEPHRLLQLVAQSR